MKLIDTVPLMNSEDYRDRFKAEYYQIYIRFVKLKANYGYRDNFVINVTEDSKQEKTVEEIEQDYQNQLPDTDNKIDF